MYKGIRAVFVFIWRGGDSQVYYVVCLSHRELILILGELLCIHKSPAPINWISH